MFDFGDYIKQIRLQKRLPLREFCRITGSDSSNRSKIEHGLVPAPKSKKTLEVTAKVLKIVRT